MRLPSRDMTELHESRVLMAMAKNEEDLRSLSSAGGMSVDLWGDDVGGENGYDPRHFGSRMSSRSKKGRRQRRRRKRRGLRRDEWETPHVGSLSSMAESGALSLPPIGASSSTPVASSGNSCRPVDCVESRCFVRVHCNPTWYVRHGAHEQQRRRSTGAKLQGESRSVPRPDDDTQLIDPSFATFSI